MANEYLSQNQSTLKSENIFSCISDNPEIELQKRRKLCEHYRSFSYLFEDLWDEINHAESLFCVLLHHVESGLTDNIDEEVLRSYLVTIHDKITTCCCKCKQLKHCWFRE